ncbi:MAG TPA: hypothetical protein DCS17_01820, partial [Flavobacterium sp.]|nr:hypothetical protein [Flavobacterium sp.]
MLNNPTVSVCMITYLHENFIEQAINGVLMQKGNFEIELIIANDNSPDETNIIVQNCIVNHPNGSWIKYTHHKTNLGMMPNFVWALQQCKGKYIAICEGDDFWTDSFKLQKQIDVLVNYPNLAGCFHNSEERFWCDYSKASTLFLENKVGREFSFSE